MRGITKRLDQLEATARARMSDYADWTEEQLAARLAEVCDELRAAGYEPPAEMLGQLAGAGRVAAA